MIHGPPVRNRLRCCFLALLASSSVPRPSWCAVSDPGRLRVPSQLERCHQRAGQARGSAGAAEGQEVFPAPVPAPKKKPNRQKCEGQGCSLAAVTGPGGLETAQRVVFRAQKCSEKV